MKYMKKVFCLFLMIAIFFIPCASAEQPNDWASAPIITEAYELSEGKLYLKWTGAAPVYQVYMDGQSVANVIVDNAVISIEKGTHAINVYPINEAKSADTTIDIGLGFGGKLADIVGLNGNLNFDLATLGLDPKNLTAGNPSETLRVDYSPSAIFSTSPEKPNATTDFDDRVILTFTDRHNADEYVIGIREGKDTNYVKFNRHSAETGAFITKNNTTVTLILDQSFLQSQNCFIPELDKKYSFTVQLRKYAENLLNGCPIDTVIHESKESPDVSYTPIAAWKTAPVITYASQTADGQVTLQWTHEDNGLGCQYAVIQLNKKLGVKIGEKEIATTNEKSYVIDDLMNGNVSFMVVPKIDGDIGTSSKEASVEIQNDWVAAPTLNCEQKDKKQVVLTWIGVEGVSHYRITIFKGDNTSLLRFVNMDFTEFTSFEIEAENGEMEYIFTYDGEIDPTNGEKFKFEIYGLHTATDGSKQTTSTTTQIITMN